MADFALVVMLAALLVNAYLEEQLECRNCSSRHSGRLIGLIFECFLRMGSARPESSTDLALPITRRTAESHGEIEARTTISEGSSFLLLPRRERWLSDDTRVGETEGLVPCDA